MKLKGITKLVLAGTALAATAATLTTATYAWYVTNDSVDVLGAEGSVAGASADGNLMVAQNKIVDTKDTPSGYQVGLASLDADSKDITAGGLKPQTKAAADVFGYTKATSFATETTYYVKDNSVYKEATTQPTAATFGNGTYYTLNTTKSASAGEWVDATGTTTAETHMQFKIWLKGTSKDGTDLTVKPSVKVTNKTASVDAIKQQAYTGTAGVAQGASFAVDAVYALRMNVTTTTLKGTTYSTPAVSVAKGSVADIDGDYTALTGTVEKTATNYDANIYYKSIMDEIGYGTNATTGASVAPEAGDKTWGNITLESGVDTLITITFWLEGTDASCYDSCMSQAFAFDFNFKL